MKIGAAMMCLAILVLAEAKSKCERPEVPRILIGGWQLTERHGRNEAIRTLHAYAEANFTDFDTADIYGPSESILGQFRAEYSAKHGVERAQTLRFFTKYVTQDATLGEARRVNEQSRTALGTTPYMVQMHWWDFSDKGDRTAASHLDTLKGEGKLQHIAACNYDTAHLKVLLDADIPVTVNQVQYSLLDRRPENGLMDLASQHGVQLTCFGAVAGGWLSDRFLDVSEQEADRMARPGTVSMRMYRSSLDAWSGRSWGLFQQLLRQLRGVADVHGCNIAVVAMAWVLERLSETCGGGVILGVRDAKHLGDAIKARSLRLSHGEMAGIRAVLDKGRPPVGDIWSRERRL